jgi:hypothetical protein
LASWLHAPNDHVAVARPMAIHPTTFVVLNMTPPGGIFF